MASTADTNKPSEQRSTYDGLRGAVSSEAPHLGGNILEGDPYTFAPRVWNYLIDRFSVRSVLDLGSGIGYSAEYFFKKGLKVVAVDGMEDNVRKAIYPTIKIDLTREFVQCNVDLVHCQEVVEHIEAQHLDKLLTSMANGKFIVMTNALPGHSGYHHVNTQPVEYWIENLKRYDCHVLAADTERVRRLAEEDGAVYLARTGTVYANRQKLGEHNFRFA